MIRFALALFFITLAAPAFGQDAGIPPQPGHTVFDHETIPPQSELALVRVGVGLGVVGFGNPTDTIEGNPEMFYGANLRLRTWLSTSQHWGVQFTGDFGRFSTAGWFFATRLGFGYRDLADRFRITLNAGYLNTRNKAGETGIVGMPITAEIGFKPGWSNAVPIIAVELGVMPFWTNEDGRFYSTLTGGVSVSWSFDIL